VLKSDNNSTASCGQTASRRCLRLLPPCYLLLSCSWQRALGGCLEVLTRGFAPFHAVTGSDLPPAVPSCVGVSACLQEDWEAEWKRELGSFTDSSTYLLGGSALRCAALCCSVCCVSLPVPG
jgi:hypothetical protein